MPAVVACPKCKKKYNLPDKMLGKGVKCSECSTQFKTPAPKSKASPANSDPRQRAALQKDQIARAQQAKALKSLGVEGTIERPADIFSNDSGMRGTPDPLANHMIQDPGFGDGADIALAPKAVEKPDDPMASMFSNPALATSKKKRLVGTGKNKKQRSTALLKQPWFLLSVFFVPGFLVSIVLSLTESLAPSTNLVIAQAVYGAFMLAGIACWIWSIKLAYEATESVLQAILVAIIPFYVIYTIATNWEIMKPYAYVIIASILITPFAIGALVLAGGFGLTTA